MAPFSPARRDALRLGVGAILAACSGAPAGNDEAASALGHPGSPGPGGASDPTSPDAASRRAPVLVLGAGISGLSAARRLKARGFTDVRVIEARDRIGGRIQTDRSTGMPFDMGAAWVHYASDKTNPLLAMVKAAGLAPRPTNWDRFAAYDELTGRVPSATLDAATSRMDAALKKLRAKVRALDDRHVALDQLLGPILASTFSGAPDEQRMLGLMRGYYVENEYATELAQIGAYDLADGPTKENDQLVGGYDVLLESLARGLRVQLSEPVTHVRVADGKVTVESMRASYTAAAVVVTLPVGVLRAGAVTFDPPIPDAKRQALADIGVGDFEKVVLLYDQAFWPSGAHGFGFASASEDVAKLVLDAHEVAGAPALVAMITGAAAARASGMSDADLGARTIAQIQAMFGAQIPAPRAVLRTRWHDDPFARGAYTYPGVADLPRAIAALAAPIGRRVFFAGEATDPTWWSFAHGAYLSGIRAANEV